MVDFSRGPGLGLKGLNALGNAWAQVRRPSQGYATQSNWAGNGLAKVGGGYIDLNINKSNPMERGQAMNESIDVIFGNKGDDNEEFGLTNLSGDGFMKAFQKMFGNKLFSNNIVGDFPNDIV